MPWRAARLVMPLRSAWRRWRASASAAEVSLDDARRRLEILLAGVYDREIPVDAAPVPPKQIWTARLMQPAHLRGGVTAGNDGRRILLPPRMDARDGREAALARYRLLAFEQAERIARGTAALAETAGGPLERDLFILRESEIVDRALLNRVRSIAPALAASRGVGLSERPPMRALTPLERAVEMILRRTLAGDPAAGGAASEADDSPAASLDWARETSRRLAGIPGAYRGLPPVATWGILLPPKEARGTFADLAPAWWHAGATTLLGAESRTAGTGKDLTDDVGVGGDPRHIEAPPESPHGAPASATVDGASNPEARAGKDSTSAETGSSSPEESHTDVGRGPTRDDSSTRIASYPEWDAHAGRYLRGAATVHATIAVSGDAAWADRERREYAALVRRIRQRFDRLRARRLRLRQQRDGQDLDLASCVSALVDWRSGHTVDDRLYLDVRPARRGLAILLLVDVSGSTEAAIGDGRRVIDVEKTALLLASEALDALGDRYAIQSFSARGAAAVSVSSLKAFGEPNGELVRRRVAALAPSGNTRLGAALRHATSILMREPAGHHLLLLLSDGRPNDSDRYQGDYAVEDSRQAVAESREAGVYPFCLTVDRESPEYLARIFGSAGHTILRRPDYLPLALVQVVRQLLAS